jgi:hypothetical protein
MVAFVSAEFAGLGGGTRREEVDDIMRIVFLAFAALLALPLATPPHGVPSAPASSVTAT